MTLVMFALFVYMVCGPGNDPTLRNGQRLVRLSAVVLVIIVLGLLAGTG